MCTLGDACAFSHEVPTIPVSVFCEAVLKDEKFARWVVSHEGEISEAVIQKLHQKYLISESRTVTSILASLSGPWCGDQD